MHVSDLIRQFLSLVAWLTMLTVIFVPLERWFAIRQSTRTREQTFRDLGYYFVNSLAKTVLLSVVAAVLIRATHRILPEAYFDWVGDLPLAVRIAATFVIGEIGFYWGHRWSHQFPILWQFHVQHHEPSHLDWLINTYAHPIDIIWGRLCGLVPIFLLGLAGTGAHDSNVPVMILTIVGVFWSFLIHANIRWPLKWIEPIIATPRFHHWHHTKSGQIDRNYASMLPILDRLFGTLHLPGREWPQDYGVRERERSN